MSPSVWLPTPSAVSVSSVRLLPTTHNHWKQNLVCGPLCDPGLGTSAIDSDPGLGTSAIVSNPGLGTAAIVSDPGLGTSAIDSDHSMALFSFVCAGMWLHHLLLANPRCVLCNGHFAQLV